MIPYSFLQQQFGIFSVSGTAAGTVETVASMTRRFCSHGVYIVGKSKRKTKKKIINSQYYAKTVSSSWSEQQCAQTKSPMRGMGTWELRFSSPSFPLGGKCSRASDYFSLITAKNIY